MGIQSTNSECSLSEMGSDVERRKLRRRNTVQLVEFVDEVSLIVIAANDRDIRPIPALLRRILRRLAKTQHARKMLGAQAGALKASAAKLARTQACSAGQCIN